MRKQLARWNMTTLRGQFARFAKDEQGAALVEYGMLVGLIAAVCIGAVTVLGANISALLTAVATAIGTVTALVPGA